MPPTSFVLLQGFAAYRVTVVAIQTERQHLPQDDKRHRNPLKPDCMHVHLLDQFLQFQVQQKFCCAQRIRESQLKSCLQYEHYVLPK